MHLYLLALILLLPQTVAWAATSISYGLGLKKTYISTLGVTIDDGLLVQPSVTYTNENGVYGYLWFNLPADTENEHNSYEFEPSIGFNWRVDDMLFDTSFILFDFENPDVFDFNNDVLGTRFRMDKSPFYIETIHYSSHNNRDGLIGIIGAEHTINDQFSLSYNLAKSKGPLHFEDMTFSKVKATYKVSGYPLTLFIERLFIFERQADEFREETTSFGLLISY